MTQLIMKEGITTGMEMTNRNLKWLSLTTLEVGTLMKVLITRETDLKSLQRIKTQDMSSSQKVRIRRKARLTDQSQTTEEEESLMNLSQVK